MLYIVATPIGNLSDITFRAIETLKKVDLILCEDTRVTRKLLSKFEIDTPIQSYHQRSGKRKIKNIIEEIKKGKNIALVCDGGTPGISDPGGKLIEEILHEIPGAKISPIPGPCALVAAASISGFPMNKFIFLGFPPSKKKRKKFFKHVLDSGYPVILYESPHRIMKTLQEILDMENREVIVLQELTKIYERAYRGHLEDIIKELQQAKIKGEFTIILKNE